MSKHTYEAIASNYNLWTEFFDVDATMTEAEFDAYTVEEKIQMQVDAFGEEE